LLDLIDNYLPMSLARHGLAAGLLFAGAAGVAVGVELTLPDPVPAAPADGSRLTLVTDAALAGIVTCGFAVFYNTAWRHLGLAALPGMVGHGLRFLVLEAGTGLLAATFLGGLAVGAISGLIAHRHRTPVAVIAFAGAVTMIPGLTLYRAFGGALRLARLPDRGDPDTVTATLSNGLQAGLVIGGLALGLVLGARAVLALAGEHDPVLASRTGPRGAGHRDQESRPPDHEPVRAVQDRTVGDNKT
jgi:uncharacterized membrane protein YjjB (DUF3815 family)